MKQSQREEFLAGASPGIRGSLWVMQALNNLESMRKELKIEEGRLQLEVREFFK